MSYMERALHLAREGLGKTSPNPSVGAVIVKEGVVVGEGFTQPPGGDHAERVALKQAGTLARGAALFVTLEPCFHHGRTPPCVPSILQAGIQEVHMAIIDPNPLVSGKGKAALEDAGVRTYVGEGEGEAREVMEAYLKHITTGLPFVTAKVAMSLDGKIATRTGESRWITGPKARAYVHQLRAASDAIMVGISTALRDDPQLTARDPEEQPLERQPVRVIVDSKARLPLKAQVLALPGSTILATAQKASPRKTEALRKAGAEVVTFPEDGGLVDLQALIGWLGKRGVTSLLVEGGGRLWTSLVDLKAIDKLIVFVAPIIIGGRRAPTPVGGEGAARISEALRLSRVRVAQMGDDVAISGYLS